MGIANEEKRDEGKRAHVYKSRGYDEPHRYEPFEDGESDRMKRVTVIEMFRSCLTCM